MSKIVYDTLPEDRPSLFVGFHLGGHKLKDGFKRWMVTKIVRIFSKPKITLDGGRKIKVSHTELIFPDRMRREKGTALSFSSDGFAGGVRFKDIDYNKHPERWIFIKVPQIGSPGLVELYNRCSFKLGCPYDYLGVVTFFGLRFIKREDPNKYWCSEVDSWALWDKPNKISPAHMFKLLHSFQEKSRVKGEYGLHIWDRLYTFMAKFNGMI